MQRLKIALVDSMDVRVHEKVLFCVHSCASAHVKATVGFGKQRAGVCVIQALHIVGGHVAGSPSFGTGTAPGAIAFTCVAVASTKSDSQAEQ